MATKGRVPPDGSLPVVLGEMIDLVHKLEVPEGPALSGGSSFELKVGKESHSFSLNQYERAIGLSRFLPMCLVW